MYMDKYRIQSYTTLVYIARMCNDADARDDDAVVLRGIAKIHICIDMKWLVSKYYHHTCTCAEIAAINTRHSVSALSGAL